MDFPQGEQGHVLLTACINLLGRVDIYMQKQHKRNVNKLFNAFSIIIYLNLCLSYCIFIINAVSNIGLTVLMQRIITGF